MQCFSVLIVFATLLLTISAADVPPQAGKHAAAAPAKNLDGSHPAAPAQPASAPGSDPPPPPSGNPAQSAAPAQGGNNTTTRDANGSVFGAGCRWDPTTSNIEEVTFEFRTGQAPPSTWFSHVDQPAAANAAAAAAAAAAAENKLRRRQQGDPPPGPAAGFNSAANVHVLKPGGHHHPPFGNGPVLDASYHTPLIDVLTNRARFGSFGSSLNSAGCALPAFSERLAQLEAQEGEIVNNYTTQHKALSGSDRPSAMFFWAGISNYDPKVRADLIQTVVFYGDGCAANPRQGMCIYSAEYSDFRYSSKDHMCMGSNMPVFYPVDTPMTVVYRTQQGFRTQEAWIYGKMVSYLRSAGDQVMNSFVITQECKNCDWPLSEQVYENIRIKFSTPELGLDRLQSCSGGARTSAPPRMEEGGKVWVIDQVVVPSGKHVTTSSTDGSGTAKQDPGPSGDGSSAARDGGDAPGAPGPGQPVKPGGAAAPPDTQKPLADPAKPTGPQQGSKPGPNPAAASGPKGKA